jgi:hypothetical protein
LLAAGVHYSCLPQSRPMNSEFIRVSEEMPMIRVMCLFSEIRVDDGLQTGLQLDGVPPRLRFSKPSRSRREKAWF